MKKRFLAVMMAVTLVAGLTACGSSSSSTTDTKSTTDTATTTDKAATTDAKAETTASTGGKELAVQIGPDPETIDPALNSSVDGGNMIMHSFECLLVNAEDGTIQAGAAEKWEPSEDGLTWTFHLRDGLKWSDGSALTAKDFVYSWKRVCDPNVAAPYAETVLGMVKGYEEAVGGNLDALGVSAPDDKTFVVELSAPCTYFESIAAFATLSPVQQATIEKNGDAWATAAESYVSNGAFYVTEWVPGSHITMSKNPNYWNAAAIKLDKLKFVLMEDSNAAYSAYQTGDVLMIKDVPTEEIPSLTGKEDYHVEADLGTYYISLNNNKEPFTNPEVRKALSLAIDRDYVANTLMQGTYTPASNLFGPGWKDPVGGDFMANANGGKPYIDTTNFAANLEQAKKILADAGYPNGEGLPTITYNTNDIAYHKVVAEYLQQAWAELGVNLEVSIVEWASFTPMRRAGDYEAARNGWLGDYSDPSNMLSIFYSTNGNNDGKYNSPVFDAAFDKSSKTMDPAERSAALHEAEDAIMNDAGCIPLAYYSDFWLQSPKITGMWHSPYGYWMFHTADITE
jgi:peptide/nickel transport system substrate-binding protein/oligopeptide transport system substrate-binding protein